MLGPLDLELAKKLIRAGSDERKFVRLVQVWATMTLPRKIWCELDTYKVSTVRMSGSTMHKLGTKPLVPSDFQDEDVDAEYLLHLNKLAAEYRQHKTREKLSQLKNHLPEGYLQEAVYMMSYEQAINMYVQRRKHRMPEWSGAGGICEWIRSLPYMSEFIEAVLGHNNKEVLS